MDCGNSAGFSAPTVDHAFGRPQTSAADLFLPQPVTAMRNIDAQAVRDRCATSWPFSFGNPMSSSTTSGKTHRGDHHRARCASRAPRSKIIAGSTPVVIVVDDGIRKRLGLSFTARRRQYLQPLGCRQSSVIQPIDQLARGGRPSAVQAATVASSSRRTDRTP